MRSTLTGLVAVSLSAFAIAVTACAEAPPVEEDLDSLAREEEATEPETKVTLPPPSNPTTETTDAGKKDEEEEEEKKDEPPPPPPPPPPTNEICDETDPSYDIKYLAASLAGTLQPCPCSTGECCYAVLGIEFGCLPK